MIQSGKGDLRVAKVLAVDRSAVHVRVYKERFSEVPRLVNMASLSIGTIHDTEHGMGHFPLARATFATWQPVRIQHEPVLEDELEGYRMWEDASGGVWD